MNGVAPTVVRTPLAGQVLQVMKSVGEMASPSPDDPLFIIADTSQMRVRVEINEGSWLFEPLDSGKRTRVTYQLLTDPGGSVTAWVANQANKTAVPDVMRALRKAATAH